MSKIKTVSTRPFSGPIAGAKENRKAHGNICVREEKPGFFRLVNINAGAREVGPWTPIE